MPECRNCNQSIKASEQVYQTRFGTWTEEPVIEFLTGNTVMEGDFRPDSEVEYWHAICPVPTCQHNVKPLVPNQREIMDSPLWKVKVNQEIEGNSATYRASLSWKKTEYGEMGLKVSYENKSNYHDAFEDIYVFIKCPECGVIQLV